MLVLPLIYIHAYIEDFKKSGKIRDNFLFKLLFKNKKLTFHGYSQYKDIVSCGNA